MADITSPRNLNPARRHRSYPRVVRRARHNSYLVKRPGHTGTRYHGPPTIRLVNLRPPPVMINLGYGALHSFVMVAPTMTRGPGGEEAHVTAGAVVTAETAAGPRRL